MISSRLDQAKEDWGFQDASTAKAFLAAQRHMGRKPPALPGHGSLRSGQSSGGSSSRQVHAVHGGGSSRSLDSRGPKPSSGGGSCLKAQDAIAEFRRMQEEASAAARGVSATMEFRSGEPNLKLMRSSKGQSQQLQGGSPRAPSPKRIGF